MRWLSAVSSLALPVAAGAVAASPRLRRDARGRLGLAVAPVAPGAVWIHASSVGEMAAAEGLIPSLAPPILLTADTDTGLDRARAIAAGRAGVWASILPLDHRWTLAPLWAEARPRALVLLEGAWWPTLVQLAVDAGIPVVRASARVGPRSRRLPGYRRWAAGATAVAARDAGEAAWLAEHQAAPVVVGGDLKLARGIPEGALRWERPLAVAASTRPGDEAAFLAAILDWPEPRPQVLVAPRHLERTAEVAEIARAHGLSLARRSSLAGDRVPPEIDGVLLDTLGELAGELRGAAVVFVGGTFDPAIGGHSPAEALAAGAPVVVGPETGAHPHLAGRCTRVSSPAGLSNALRTARAEAIAPVDPAITAALIGRHPPAAEVSPRPWLGPIAPPLLALGGARRWLRRQLAPDLGAPVLVVGSVNPRGPGKTATARWWAGELASRGFRPGIAVRGTGRALRGVRCSLDGAGWRELGDEGAALAAAGSIVAAGERAGAGGALIDAGCDVVVVDDGWGCRLRADRLLWVVDARWPGARGPLPAGERRSLDPSPPDGDGVVVHHASDRFPPPEAGFIPQRVARRSHGPWHCGDRPARLPDGPLALFAGLGRPADALAGVERDRVELWSLRDHQPVDRALAAELRRWAGERPLLCTAKDRARLSPDLADEVWWRELSVAIDDPPASWFPAQAMPRSADADHL